MTSSTTFTPVKIGDRVIYVDCSGNAFDAEVCKILAKSFTFPATIELMWTTPHGRRVKKYEGVSHISDRRPDIALNFWCFKSDIEMYGIEKLIKADYTNIALKRELLEVRAFA